MLTSSSKPYLVPGGSRPQAVGGVRQKCYIVVVTLTPVELEVIYPLGGHVQLLEQSL